MVNFPLFIASRIFSDKGDKRKVSKPAIRIATAGVAIGLAVMIVSVCVVIGFKHTICDKVVGFGSHITVGNFMTLQSNEQYPICMNDSMMNVIKGIQGVKHVQRFAMKQGILKTDSDFLGVMLKGIGPEYDTTFMHQNIVAGRIPKFSDTASGNKIVISKQMADKLKLNVGDRIFTYFINGDVRIRRFSIVGIYQTNLTRFDEVIAYTDLYTAVKLNEWATDQASGAEVTVSNFNQLEAMADKFVKRINRTVDHYGETYSSETIKDANPQIFSWLDLLDLNVWIILGLMVCVAGFTMVSGLLIITLERTNMIGVLKALGAKNRTIRHTFLWFSVFIIGRGLFIGDLIGIGIVVLQHYTGIIKLDAQTYYVSTVPAEINVPLIIAINLGTLLISMSVLIAPSFLISHIHPAKSMHYE